MTRAPFDDPHQGAAAAAGPRGTLASGEEAARVPGTPGHAGPALAPGPPGFDRSHGSDRPERADRSDWPERSDRPERSEGGERSERFPGSFGARVPSPAAGDVAPGPQTPAAGAPRAPAAAAATPAATSPASEPESLNLARRPFVNTRPVARVAAILWVLGALLLAANVALFRGYLTKSQTTRYKLAGLERDIAAEKRAGAELQSRIGTLKLDQQNREVTFLNRKIDERTFSWSLLFERMKEVLPDQVRLLRLKPTNVVQRDIGLGPRPSPHELNPPLVTLTMHCEAKNDEALLRFVDNMFAHPAFAEPNLQSEEREDSGLVRFDLVVQYQPNPQAARAATLPARRSGTAGAAKGSGISLPPSGRSSPGGEAAPALPVSPAGAGLIRVAPAPRRPPAGRAAPPPAGTTGGRR
jgi:Tfp pilus assembly protein PilN